MIFLGLLLGLVGTDVNSGRERFTFGLPMLSDGIGFVPVAMGLFGVAEILDQPGEARPAGYIGTRDRQPDADARGCPAGVRRRCCAAPRSARCSASCPAAARCSARSPPTRSRRRSPRDPSRFGQGAIEGVAAPEAANNAGAQTSFIPLLTLGIPSQPGHGADDRRDDDPGHRARPAGHDAAARRCSGASSPACGSAT